MRKSEYLARFAIFLLKMPFLLQKVPHRASNDDTPRHDDKKKTPQQNHDKPKRTIKKD
jgi:hypothetical protein